MSQTDGDLKKQRPFPSTFQGLCVTLLSTFQLSQLLLDANVSDFRYFFMSSSTVYKTNTCCQQRHLANVNK
jgi:hypothetical protein